ncbi:hypothetical protein L2E82_14419 [Cichorium intybus]|uniref:Uncharacterized protein n=1 Tax=Cichorium intybus TaxID=13427 RepID=A0ACB9F176_CICIN|nr:hypothetical protein L2E82_14419 [Cichorium intybus]
MMLNRRSTASLLGMIFFCKLLILTLVSHQSSSVDLYKWIHQAFGRIWIEFYGSIQHNGPEAEAGILSKARTPTINFVLGGPGVGKGTQCARIAETYGFTHLSVTEVARIARASGIIDIDWN